MATLKFRQETYSVVPILSNYFAVLEATLKKPNQTIEDLRLVAKIIKLAIPDLPEDAIAPDSDLPINMDDYELLHIMVALGQVIREQANSKESRKKEASIIAELKALDPKAGKDLERRFAQTNQSLIDIEAETEELEEFVEEEDDYIPPPPKRSVAARQRRRQVID